MAKKSIELKLISLTEKMKGNKTVVTAKIKAANADTAISYFKGRFGIRDATLVSNKLNDYIIKGTA